MNRLFRENTSLTFKYTLFSIYFWLLFWILKWFKINHESFVFILHLAVCYAREIRMHYTNTAKTTLNKFMHDINNL